MDYVDNIEAFRARGRANNHASLDRLVYALGVPAAAASTWAADALRPDLIEKIPDYGAAVQFSL